MNASLFIANSSSTTIPPEIISSAFDSKMDPQTQQLQPNCNISKILLEYHTTCTETPTFTNFDECPVVPKFWPIHHEQTSTDLDRLANGLLATFIVIICTILGAFILPAFKNKEKLFGQIMLFFTALAVSALSGAALMVLIPEGLGLDGCGARFEWQNLMACGGIFVFFIIRRLLHLITGHDDVFTQECRPHGGEPSSMWVKDGNIVKTGETVEISGSENSENAKFLESSDSSTAQITLEITDKKGSVEKQTDKSQKAQKSEKQSFKQSLKTMKSVGWMTLLGDSAHNFLDGVAIGATFHQPGCASKAIAKGWQVTIAVLAEEFPHELGDFAVLQCV